MKKRLPPFALMSAFATPVLYSSPAWGQTIDVATLTPECPAPYSISNDKSKCEIDMTRFKEDTCKAAGFKFTSGACTTDRPPPSPQCNKVIDGLYVKDGKCVAEKGAPTSAASDYVGDYFKIVASPNPDRIGYPFGTVMKVMSQRPIGDNDRLLTMAEVPSKEWYRWVLVGWANPEAGAIERDIRASDLIDAGASRIGWTYGALALPYKYHLHDKSFGSELTIGPYIGRRFGRAGSAFTIAATAGIGNVKGEVRDDAGNITDTPNLQAFTVAIGMMWDITKATNIKPFKVGVFVGQDRVSSSEVVKYEHNGKTWISFQIGYDFTDK